MLTDTELLERWYEDRGKRTPKVPAKIERALLPALRERFAAQMCPDPLMFCPQCGCRMRGEHHLVAVKHA